MLLPNVSAPMGRLGATCTALFWQLSAFPSEYLLPTCLVAQIPSLMLFLASRGMFRTLAPSAFPSRAHTTGNHAARGSTHRPPASEALLQLSLTSSTSRSHSASFIYLVLHVSETTLKLFAPQLSSFISHRTVKCYLAVVRSLEIDFSFSDSMVATPRLERVLQGTKPSLTHCWIPLGFLVFRPVTPNVMLCVREITTPSSGVLLLMKTYKDCPLPSGCQAVLPRTAYRAVSCAQWLAFQPTYIAASVLPARCLGRTSFAFT